LSHDEYYGEKIRLKNRSRYHQKMKHLKGKKFYRQESKGLDENKRGLRMKKRKKYIQERAVRIVHTIQYTNGYAILVFEKRPS
jgi:hypothetical protein